MLCLVEAAYVPPILIGFLAGGISAQQPSPDGANLFALSFLAGKKIAIPSQAIGPAFSLRILHATEPQSSGTILARRHHQKFTVLCQFICFGEIPDRPLRLVVTSASQDSASSVLVEKFISPLPNVADQVHHAERACAFWMSGDGIWAAHRSALVRSGDRGSIPLIPPRVKPAIGALGGILPLPFARQPLSSPGGIRARILQGNPCDRLVPPTLRVCSILPVAQEIQVICRTIMRCI